MHYTGDRHRLLSVKHVLLHIGQDQLDPRLDGRLLCHCRYHVSSPFWPPEVQDVPFANEEDGDIGHYYLCPRTQTVSQASDTGQPNRYATFERLPSRHTTTGGHVTSFAYKEGKTSAVPVLRCLEVKEMQRVSVQCHGSQFPSSVPRVSPLDGYPICVCRQGLYHETHSPPVTDTVHATKQRCRGSLRKKSGRWRVQKAFGDLSLEMPGSLPSILWMLISIYPSIEVTDNFFDFSLGTQFTHSGHCRLAFLQHFGYSPRL